MSNGENDTRHLSSSQRRAAAREKAHAIRAERRKKDRRGKLLIALGVAGTSLAIIAVVALVILDAAEPARSGPRNMLSDGIKIAEQYQVVQTGALSPDAEPVPHPVAQEPDVIDIQIYVDYFAPNAKLFRETNNEQLETWIESGAVTVEFHPLSILNPNSQGTQYSTRSANAAACVANFAPESYWDVSNALLSKQPEERTPGLSDEELIELVDTAGVSNQSNIETCIREQTFRRWVQAATLRALEGPLPGYEGEAEEDNKVTGTPTILVNGIPYKGRFDDEDAFAAFVLGAAGAAFNEKSTETPTPTTTPTPATAG